MSVYTLSNVPISEEARDHVTHFGTRKSQNRESFLLYKFEFGVVALALPQF